MTPYPFAPMPTLAEFLSRAADEYGARRRIDEGLNGPRGTGPLEYMERDLNGTTLSMVIPDYPNTERLDPDQVRLFCRRLGIPIEAFWPSIE